MRINQPFLLSYSCMLIKVSNTVVHDVNVHISQVS